MPDIHIHRDHQLGLPEARKIAFAWAEQAENDFSMACTYQEGTDDDLVTFKRSGVSGQLQVTPTAFVLDAKLGFLLGTFKDKIEGEIVKNLDTLLATKPAAKSAEKKPPKRGSR